MSLSLEQQLELTRDVAQWISGLPLLVTRVLEDGAVYEASREAFERVAALPLHNAWEDVLYEALQRGWGGFPRWVLALAYLATVYSQANLAQLTTHTFTPADLEDLHGMDATRAAQAAAPGDGSRFSIQGVTYEAHEILPLWRRVDVELCKAHGIAKAETVDMETGEALLGCPKCMREAS